MPIVKTFSIPLDWKYSKKFETLTSEELRGILEKYWRDSEGEK